MAGLLDYFTNGTPYQMDPTTMGLLGAGQAISQAFAPQPASRLPLARPNIPYLLGQAAGGFGQGYGAGLQQQKVQAGTQGQQIKNLNDALSYNLWAPYLGQKPIGVNGIPATSAPGVTAPVTGAPAGSLPGAGGGGTAAPSPAAEGSQPDMASLFSTMPPPLLQRMGVTVPAELTAAWYAGIKPGTPEWNTIVRNVAIKASGVTPSIPAARSIPPQNYNLATGHFEADTSALPAMQAGAAAIAKGTGEGGLGAKEAQAAFEAGLKVKTEDTIAQHKAFYDTGVVPPAYGDAMKVQISPSGDIGTPKGTVVPAAPQQTTFPGTDAILKQNANTQETEKSFGAIRPTLEGTEARMVALAKALQTVQSGGLNEHRADIANSLRGLGMPKLADAVLSAKDTAAVQTAMGLQTLDVLGQLKQINQGTGGRILNSEFTNLIDKQYGPDLSPQANYDLITQALGGIYQTKNMIDDYYKYGKPGGWRDANAFQSAYYSDPHNSYQNMVDYAGKAIGPLKGMVTTPPSGAVNLLRQNPMLAPQFDQKYGRGASTQFLLRGGGAGP